MFIVLMFRNKKSKRKCVYEDLANAAEHGYADENKLLLCYEGWKRRV